VERKVEGKTVDVYVRLGTSAWGQSGEDARTLSFARPAVSLRLWSGACQTKGRTGAAACRGGPCHEDGLMVGRSLSAAAIVRLDGAGVNGSKRGRQREPRATQGVPKSLGATSLPAGKHSAPGARLLSTGQLPPPHPHHVQPARAQAAYLNLSA
jgi:hypothetical protein